MANPQTKDVSGAPFTVAGNVDGNGVFAPAHTIRGLSLAGADWSATPVAIPFVAGWPVLLTVPANPARAGIDMQNQSASGVQVVIDDGAGGSRTSIFLEPNDPGASVPAGATWSSLTCKARVQVYGPSGSSVSVRED